jgi:predicted metal-dependent peptidase
MNEDAKNAMTRARTALILDQPFFGTLALNLQLVENASIPTAAVDGVSLFYNPHFILDQADRIKLSIVCHEVGHCMLDHIGREDARAHNRWNRACDYCVNLILYDSGFDIPNTWLLDEQYRDMSAEHIYQLLQDEDGAGTLGSHPGPGEPGGPMDDIRPAPAVPGGPAAAGLAQTWQINVLQAAQVAKEAGKLPASLERLAQGIAAPTVDWPTLLRRFISARASGDYSWARPNRRMIVHGVYLPSLYSETVDLVAVGVDTSGSIDAVTLAAFGAEIGAIMAEVRPLRVVVLYCDARVGRVDIFEQGEPFKLHPVGGGGTAFKPVFERLEAMNVTPSALVYLTDLYGPCNFPPPGYPVLWCCTSDNVAPWGDTVRIVL